MDDPGKTLYEIHCQNVLQVLPEHGDWITPWEKLEPKAKECWRKTANFQLELEVVPVQSNSFYCVKETFDGITPRRSRCPKQCAPCANVDRITKQETRNANI